MASFILNLQYPKTLDEAKFQRDYWRDQGLNCIANFEALELTGKKSNIGYWNTPLSAMPGDICFFSCATSAISYIRKLQAEADMLGDYPLYSAIKRSRLSYDRLGGCIFGYAYVLDKPRADPGKTKVSPGWSNMCGFSQIGPYPISSFEFIKLNNFGGITNLDDKSSQMLCLEINIGQLEHDSARVLGVNNIA